MAHPRQVRSLQLDFLRGVAILLVLVRHTDLTPEEVGFWRPVFRPLLCVGWTGVDLFFVLSGFLIGGLLFKELASSGALDVRRFLLRRGWKIWPPYFALVAYGCARNLWRGHGDWHALRPLVPNFLHLQNYWETTLPHTWSLAVEEHFYLALPLLLLLLTRWPRGVRAVPLVVGAVAVACLLLRLRLPGPFRQFNYLTATHLRIDGLAFGVLLAYLAQFHAAPVERLARRRWVLLAAAAALVAPMAVLEIERRFVWTVGYSLLYLGFGCLLLSLTYTPLGQGAVGRVLASRPARLVAWVGFYSYSIYIWHLPLVAMVHRIDPLLARWPPAGRAAVIVALYFAVACGVGVIMAWLIERPALALRERLFPPRALAESVLPPAAREGGFVADGLRLVPAPNPSGDAASA